MGYYTITVDDDVMQAFKNYVLKKHGKLHKALGETITKALKLYLKKVALELPPGKEVQAEEKTAEDKNFDEREAESGRGIDVTNEEAILQKVGHFPKTITKDGLVRFLVSRGYDEKRAKQIIGLLVVNGTYIEKGKWLYLAKTKKEEVVVNEGN